MQKGLPELLTLAASLFIPQVLIDALPSKLWSYIVFIPAILSIYISFKIIEKVDNERGTDETIE